MSMEGLSTYETTQSPSEWTKTDIVGAVLRIFGLREGHFGTNIGINGQGEEVALPSRALKHAIGA